MQLWRGKATLSVVICGVKMQGKSVFTILTPSKLGQMLSQRHSKIVS